ncbi:Putative histidine kinase containing cheY-homologous receiver domain [Klebsormidium nitens]|uniref:Putative histidine kinase containing cheY-homologous receiver domain n=1 Tax=Klebsormidium nitens TaxID=105231 RepID=A0A1Y1HUE7_KLENI|nr:Putative histidine kinase containing cheY-homologous receiver domain [Klebsormidium nitens]|eukprot:GAQ81462.1 Putative histidine kinase containing cheY-homologous receiver domain [Klebsormidium nitens]
MPGPDSVYDPKGAPKLRNEDFRINVLHSYNILDTEPEARFDRLTALAARIFKAKASLVTLVDSERVFFKSNTGSFEGCGEVPRSTSFCPFVTLPTSKPCLVVLDASKDGRFHKNPLVCGEPHMRFYAGVPLETEGGFVLGSFCIVDFEPRESFSEEEQEMLVGLAKLAIQEIEKHNRAAELQRLQQKKFEEDKRGLLQAIDAFSEGLVLVDVSQKGQPIVFVNEGWEKITGYSANESRGQHCGSLLQGPLTSLETTHTITQACKEGRPASVEILNYRKDGTPFWNWLRIRPVEGSNFGLSEDTRNGQGRYYFGILSDCTRRKEKELELEAIRLRELEAEASVRAKRSFVANISHELRTPMNAILACSQLLTDMPSLTDDQRELSRMIQGSGQQLLRLINDILDFSKMDAGKMELRCAEFNLWGCLDYCVEMLAMRCESKGLDLSYNMDESVPDWIWADDVRLSQILTNLLSNAAKFTEEGGEIEVSVSAVRRSPRRTSSDGAGAPSSAGRNSAPENSAHLPEYEVTFAVRDTGIGIPAAFQEVLFDAFTQCDNSRTKKYEGTGLGLAISRDLAERMGGRMWVESEEGKGSTFYVSIFARGSMRESSGVALSPEQAVCRAATPVTGKRALLVGGRNTFQRMVGSMLRVWGLEVSVAASVEELHGLLGPAEKGRLQAPSNGRKFVRVDVGGSQGKPFDVVIVDCFDTVKRTKHGRKGAVDGGANGRTAPADLVALGCQLAERVPTFLLTSKDTKSLISQWADMENAVCLSRSIRINLLYATLLQRLAHQDPLSPLTTPRSLLDSIASDYAEGGDATSLEILVVEDNKVNQRVLNKVLKSLDYDKIRTAGNGREVLELLRQQPADVVLMDVQMPEMDGLTATTRIKADISDEDQPMVIALTADVGNDIEKECREAGMISYLSKPVQKSKLEKLLAKCGYYKQHRSERKMLKWIDAS